MPGQHALFVLHDASRSRQPLVYGENAGVVHVISKRRATFEELTMKPPPTRWQENPIVANTCGTENIGKAFRTRSTKAMYTKWSANPSSTWGSTGIRYPEVQSYALPNTVAAIASTCFLACQRTTAHLCFLTFSSSLASSPSSSFILSRFRFCLLEHAQNQQR